MVTIKRIVRIAILLVLLVLLLPGCDPHATIPAVTTLNNPTNIRYVRVVTDDNYPPYAFRDNAGNLKGIVVDQWTLWEHRTGIHVDLVGMSWDKAQTAMKNGEFDVIDTIFITDERASVYDFTRPYAKLDVSIFFASTISGITNAESLRGFSVAVKRGDSSVEYLKNHGITDLLQYDNYADIISAVRERKAVVFVMDKPPALYLMNKAKISNQYNYTQPLYTGEFHRAVRRGNAELLSVVEQGFDMIPPKEYENIDKIWFGTSAADYADYLPLVGYGAAGIAVALLVLLGWNRMLKTRVARRTVELEEALSRLRLSESQNIAILKALPQLVLVLGRGGTLLRCLSDAKGFGLYQSLVHHVGRVSELFAPETAERMDAALRALIETGDAQEIEFMLSEQAGISYYKATYVVCDAQRVLMLVSNITGAKRAEQQLYELSIYDPLTRAFNRQFFEQKTAALQAEGRAGVGVVSCDLDGLKLINDTLGHAAGDEYIRTAANIIRACLGEEAFFARVGGDEFVALVRNATHGSLEQKKAEIYAAINRENATQRAMPLSVSVGFALWRDTGEPLSDAIKLADDYMYRDKLNHMQSIKSKNIDLLSKMLEARDFITEGHGDRLQRLAGELARAVGMSHTAVQDIKLLAQFHDIGKIGVADAVLFKPGRHTPEEAAAMRRHTEIGYRIALSSPDILHIADWILKHHESYDGTGYPFGLKGEDIPLECRILSIADAYDAMTHDRPYRKAMPPEEAAAELRRCAGRQFDPALVEKFLALLERDGARA